MQTELDHLTTELYKLTARKQQLLEDLPALCALSASLQDTQVLHEDYSGKLLRQQHSIAKKKACLRLLLEQHARHQLLCLARDAEVKELQTQMQDLQLLLDVLTDAKAASQHRIAAYVSKECQLNTNPKAVVDDSDSFLQTLHELLSAREADNSSNSNKAQLYVTVEQLKSQLRQLASDSDTGAAQQHAEGLHKQIAASLQASFGSLHSVLMPENGTDAAQLTKPELAAALQQAQRASTDLTETVQQVTQQQHLYQNLLSQQRRSLEAERQVFSRFHASPATLQEICLGL